MFIRDEAALANERLWDNEVQRGCGYAVPWLDLDAEFLRECAAGKHDPLPSPLDAMHPACLWADLDGKEVLCLASGGGQQSAVFSLLGARVTVVDLSSGQLEGDTAAATHYGYEVRTVHGDMRVLNEFADNTFDLVYQPESLCYMPDVAKVFSEVGRVLKPGGVYRVNTQSPALYATQWEGEKCYLDISCKERVHLRDDGGIEYAHTMPDIFNGLLDAGLTLQRIYERPYALENESTEPGTWEWEHWVYCKCFAFIVVARER